MKIKDVGKILCLGLIHFGCGYLLLLAQFKRALSGAETDSLLSALSICFSLPISYFVQPLARWPEHQALVILVAAINSLVAGAVIFTVIRIGDWILRSKKSH